MTSQNNAASKAVQAELCPNDATSKAVQAMVRAIRALANENLLTADWSDFNTEFDNVCALAIKHLKGIHFIGPVSSEQFLGEWDMSISAVRLMSRACPANQAHLREQLKEVVQLSMALADKVELASSQEGCTHVD